ncbi:MAG: hypothetical protein V3S33_03975 [Gammaproteobacteria bacterium]
MSAPDNLVGGAGNRDRTGADYGLVASYHPEKGRDACQENGEGCD